MRLAIITLLAFFRVGKRGDAVRRFAVGVLAILVFFFATPANSAERQVLRGHIPAAVAKLKSVDRLASTKRLNLVIALPLRNREALTNLLQEIYDPTSPNYHQYLTPEQFAERFGPTEQDYQAVMDFANAHGLTVTGTHPNRTLVDVSGLVADVEKAFQVNLRVYQHPLEARMFYAPDSEPSVDLALPVLEVVGLDDYVVPHPLFFEKAPPVRKNGAKPDAGSGPFGTYMGNDFRGAYVPGVTLAGEGQKVGLFQLDGYYTNDPVQYAIQAGLTNTVALTTLTNVLVGGFDGTPGANNVEVALDIEMVMSMAPGAQIIVYEAANAGSGPIDVLNRMATDDVAKQLSTSWSYATGPATVQVFLQMAGQGQTFFSSSGDHGAYSGAVTGPKDVPYITIVGGTTLTTSGPGGAWTSETTLNWGNGFASGGGISTSWPIPNWQQGIDMTSNHGSTTMRNIPDVAMVADDVYAIADNGLAHYLGGTSVAAPLWAAFTALINQKAALEGDEPVGFINPTIYAIGNGTSYNTAFHDITTGNNTNSSSPTNFFAVTGYDLCTGWGSPAPNLIDELLNVNILPATGWTLTSLPNMNWSSVASSADGKTLVAVSRQSTQPYISTTSGTTWRTGGPSAGWNGVACSADGTKMAAAAPEGSIAISSDSGVTWTATTSPAYFWTSIASSADGAKLAAGAAWEGVFEVSTNSGATWAVAAMPSGRYSPVAWSADGSVLVASPGGVAIYVSTNCGNTCSSSSLPGIDCKAVASSTDGSTLVAAGNSSVYVSKDFGKTWAVTSAFPLGWTSVACSADGYRLAAAANGIGIYISDDGGLTWSNTGPRNAQWSSVACSADGIRLVAVVDYYFDGPVYTGFFPRGGPTIQTLEDQWVIVGSNAVFSASVAGPSPLHYQWRFNGTNLVNATNATLVLTNVQFSQAGNYAVQVSNNYGMNLSAGAVLTVLPPPPVILTQPADLTAVVGHTANFTVTASGTPPLSYQWHFNGTNIAGATNSSLMLFNVQLADAGNYTVTVTNQYGSVISSNALLTVIPPPPCVEPVSGLIGWWQAEGNTTNRAGANNGSLVGNVTYGPGKVGQSFILDGNGDAISIGNPSIVPLGELTVEMWIKRASATLSSQSGGNAYLFGCGSGIDGFRLSDGGELSWQNGCCLGSGGIVNDTNWHHVAMIATGSGEYIYVDGILRGASMWPQGFSFTSAAIGARVNTSNSFYGAIDEPSLYNRALSAAEIQSIYNAGVYGKCWLPEAPYILVPPTNQTVIVGKSASFTVAADGRPRPLSYHWTFKGTNIYGATNVSLILTNVQLNQSGNYAVVVTNAQGFATSSATLTVQVTNPPIFSSVVVLSDGTVQGMVTGYTGPISVEASTNLYDWETVTDLVLTNTPALFSDFSATNYPQRFYRARLK